MVRGAMNTLMTSFIFCKRSSSRVNNCSRRIRNDYHDHEKSRGPKYSLRHANEYLRFTKLVGRFAIAMLLDVTVFEDFLHTRASILFPLGERLVGEDAESEGEYASLSRVVETEREK